MSTAGGRALTQDADALTARFKKKKKYFKTLTHKYNGNCGMIIIMNDKNGPYCLESDIFVTVVNNRLPLDLSTAIIKA